MQTLINTEKEWAMSPRFITNLIARASTDRVVHSLAPARSGDSAMRAAA